MMLRVFHCVDVFPEVVAHLIASDLGTQYYDEAWNVKRLGVWWNGRLIKKADLYMEHNNVELNHYFEF